MGFLRYPFLVFFLNMKVWDFENLRCTLSITAHENQIIGIECILKGFDVLYVFTASHDATIKMWDNTFKHVHTFKGHLAPVRALIRIEDCILSGGEDNQIKVRFGVKFLNKKDMELGT